MLAVQLGTPDAPTPAALRRYLREFLGDPRVLDLPAVGRWLLLNLIILPFRPRKSAELYRRVWTEEGSPLLRISQAQVRGLRERLGPGVLVELGMRYGSPRLTDALQSLLDRGCHRVLVLPLFPQYCSATSASVYDAAFAAACARRAVPALRVVPPYSAHPGFVAALVARLEESLGDDLRERRLVFSFHGIPRRYIDDGDPYADQCRRTMAAVAAAAALREDRTSLAFQSRFGREEWLRPYADEEFARIAREEGGDLAVICPGFVADCLETVDEIGNEGARAYREAGGGELVLVPCVNDHPRWLDALADIVRGELAGWLPAPA